MKKIKIYRLVYIGLKDYFSQPCHWLLFIILYSVLLFFYCFPPKLANFSNVNDTAKILVGTSAFILSILTAAIYTDDDMKKLKMADNNDGESRIDKYYGQFMASFFLWFLLSIMMIFKSVMIMPSFFHIREICYSLYLLVEILLVLFLYDLFCTTIRRKFVKLTLLTEEELSRKCFKIKRKRSKYV